MPGTKGKSGGDRRSRKADPTAPDSGPKAPPTLSPDGVEVWNEIVPTLPADRLRFIDTYQLEVMCNLIARMRQIEQKNIENPDIKNDRILLQMAQQMGRFSQMFLMDPDSRERSKYEPPKPSDSATDWEAE